jgi:hypothetical protein
LGLHVPGSSAHGDLCSVVGADHQFGARRWRLDYGAYNIQAFTLDLRSLPVVQAEGCPLALFVAARSTLASVTLSAASAHVSRCCVPLMAMTSALGLGHIVCFVDGAHNRAGSQDRNQSDQQ